jgi:hypothetical protein
LTKDHPNVRSYDRRATAVWKTPALVVDGGGGAKTFFNKPTRVVPMG